jgi:RecA-family ATPase
MQMTSCGGGKKAINASYQADFDALCDVHWLPRVGEDNLLMTFSSKGVGDLTLFHAQVLSAALDLKARFVAIDTVADTFAGNENDRSQVRQFVQRALGSIALKIDGAVLACAHPSRAGITSGEGDGGSTGWSNAFRSRLYLRGARTEEGEANDHNARILQRRKANYAARSDELRLRWRDGVIEPEAPESRGATAFGTIDANTLFLNLLAEFEGQARPVSTNSRAGNYAPRAFARLPRGQRCDYREMDFVNAMERLLANRQIENVPYGRPSKGMHKLVKAGQS